MTLRIYQTTLVTSDGAAALEMVSIPSGTMAVNSMAPLELMLETPLTTWEPILPEVAPGFRDLRQSVELLLGDVFGSSIAPGHLDEILGTMSDVPLMPVEQSDPVLQTLGGLGGAGTASAALLYGVSTMGPLAIVALPAGIFLWYVAKPAGEGVGGWIKNKFADQGDRS